MDKLTIKETKTILNIKQIGNPGPRGLTPTVEVGDVFTINYDEQARVENVGSQTAVILDFYIPKGEDGSGGGSSNEIQNVGTGAGVFKQTLNHISTLKSLLSLNNVLLINENDDTIDFNIDSRVLNNLINENLSGINEELTLIEANITTIFNDLTTTQENIDSINQEIVFINNSIDTFNTSLNNLYLATNGNTNSIISIQSSIGGINTSISNINDAITSLQNQVASNTSSIASNTTSINTANTNITALQSKVLPSGGTTGQVLAKTSGADYAASWQTPSSGVNEGSGSGANSSVVYSKNGLMLNTTGIANSAIGYNALLNNTTGSYNTVVGNNSGSGITTGGYNTIVGTNNLNLATYPSSYVIFGAYNLLKMTDTSGSKPTIAIGNDNLKNLVNQGVGSEYNIAIGWGVMGSATTARNNIAIGKSALTFISSGEENTVIGNGAHSNNGSDNCAFGFQSGYNAQGSNNSWFGAYTGATNQTVNNSSMIGYQADVTGSNQVQLGNSATTTYAYGAIQNRSDARDKANIRDNALGKDFIMGLKPKQWQWNYRSDYVEIIRNEDGTTSINELENDGSKIRTRFHNGFIAQEVLELMTKLGIDFAGLQHHTVDGGKDVYTLGYEQFISPIVNTIQEQERTILSMQSTIEALMARLTILENK